MYEAQLPVRRRPLPSEQQVYAHNHTRTTSSNVFPSDPPQKSSPMQLAQPLNHNRRSPSVNTFSTVSSSGMASPAAYRTSPTSDNIRRSTSSRSAGPGGQPSQPSSYVALLRRQKATVWSERAQLEDPRIVAQQRAARARANREIVATGGYVTSGSGRTSTGLSAGGKVAAKIRHHKGSTLGFGSDSNYVGIGGVPLRLSATEVEGGDSDDDDLMATGRLNHRRTGSSGRSSTASGRRGPQFRTSTGALVSNSQAGSRRWSPGDTPERTGSLVDDQTIVNAGISASNSQADLADTASGKARSTTSGSSAERHDNVPDLSTNAGRLPANSASHATVTREKSVRTAEDLRRRGSVDERTMTMSTGRLFIANPD